MNQLLEEKYKELGISEKVYAFGEKIEQELKERFEKIDANAEYNQMKVIAAMQKNRVSAECFNISSGYGYNDMGRDTLERVYADCFGGEDALVRPQITCGTHALAWCTTMCERKWPPRAWSIQTWKALCTALMRR